jgi:DNA-binding NtrC family response regulator
MTTQDVEKSKMEEAVKNNAYTCLCKPLNFEKVLKLQEGILAKKTKAQINQTEVN